MVVVVMMMVMVVRCVVVTVVEGVRVRVTLAFSPPAEPEVVM